MSKVFKTLDEQVIILKNRGLLITEHTKRVLEKENYYSLINGYKELFIHTSATPLTDEEYKLGTSFEEIKALYDFDSNLRMIFLKRILRVENNFKSAIAYTFSKEYGHDNYLKIENFDTVEGKNKVDNLKNILKLFQGIQGEIARNIGKHKSIKHYMTEHGYASLWVLVNVLSMGTISKFFNLMKQKDRHKVGKSFSIQENELSKIMGFLTLVRNKCAHDERLFDFAAKTQITTTPFHKRLSIPLTPGGQPAKGNHDVFAVLICLKLLLDKEDFIETATELNNVVKKLEASLNTVSIDQVFNKMGFPANWLEIKDL